MFTGIIERLGSVRQPAAGASPLRVESGFVDLAAGESIAVNGVCLTLEQSPSDRIMTFDLSPETLSRTTLGQLRPGEKVNLERALSLSGRLGGHLVTGHVDGLGRVISARQVSTGLEMEIEFPREISRYLVVKGSVAVEGVSLTIAKISSQRMTLALVPYTLSRSNLAEKKPGQTVNLEVDILARYLRG